MIGKFGEAARRALEAGFQLIEIHGAHGYLINQFLSAFSNIRNDEYGGSIPGRTRFAAEVVKEVRGHVGKDFPISFKISAQICTWRTEGWGKHKNFEYLSHCGY